MKSVLLLFCITLSLHTFSKSHIIKRGDWEFNLHISASQKIIVPGTINRNTLTIHNGTEEIKLNPFINKGDSLIVSFPLYHSSLIITDISKRKLRGYWRNYQRKGNYTIPFTAIRKPKKVKNSSDIINKYAGRWETTIQYNKPTKLVGEFFSSEQTLTGTFRSETGDYRYLAGNVEKDSMYLSCFDGTHCYLFKAKLFNEDSLSGYFYSGNHFKTTWTAKKNENFELRNPDSLTYITRNSAIKFSLLSTENEEFHYSSDRSTTNTKPTIIQIFGSWCPNCMDETKFLNEVYEQYENKIDIIGIGFEMGATDKVKMDHLRHYKKQMKIKYPILLGGSATKTEAAKLFPMLNHIMSFPTLLVLDQKGNVVKIHTGFNGPATGQYYTDFKANLTGLLNDLLL